MNPERRIARLDAKLEMAGISDALLTVFGGRGRDVMSEEKKEKIRDDQERAKSLARRSAALERDIRAFQPFRGLTGFSTLYELDFWGPETEPLQNIQESLCVLANVLGQILQNHGRADLTIDLLVEWVFKSDWQRKKPFRAWGLLALVFGVDPKKLCRRVAQIRKLRGPDSWPHQQK
jgi:hypothetical protein